MQYPKGYLVAVGGAEEKNNEKNKDEQGRAGFFDEGILKQIVTLAGKKRAPRIEVVTTATESPEETAQEYKKAFRKLGCEHVGHLNVQSRDEADSKKIKERLQKCNCILFSGGDQLRLSSVLGGTEFLKTVRERYLADHFVIAGTSAGASALTDTMIYGGDEEKAFLKGTLDLSIGLGFIQETIIDTHFDARGRFGRLLQAIAMQPGAIGIGLDEDTGVVVEKGVRMRAIGNKSVVVADGRAVTHNNIADAKNGMPLSLSPLTVHIMTRYDEFDLQSRQFFADSVKE